MLKERYAHRTNVRVDSYENKYLVNFASAIGATHIVRGIRNIDDAGKEQGMRHINGDLNPDITTVFFMPPRLITEVSSSMVKGLIGPQGWERVVAAYVSKSVHKKLIASHHTIWKNLVTTAYLLHGILP